MFQQLQSKLNSKCYLSYPKTSRFLHLKIVAFNRRRRSIDLQHLLVQTLPAACSRYSTFLVTNKNYCG